MTSNVFKTFLPIDPIPCPRPRIAVIRGHGVAYFPKSYKDWKEEFAGLFVDKPFTSFSGPVQVRMCFDIQKPRTSKLVLPKGDIDNYAKSVLDGLTTVGMWDDDKQVAVLLAIKRFVHDPVVNASGVHLQITPYVPEEFPCSYT
jgi:Holliday junction resolvase RusA-like endonuclease